MERTDQDRVTHVVGLCYAIVRGEWRGDLGILATTAGVGLAEYVTQDWKCTTVLAQRLRDESWGTSIVGSTTPSIHHQFSYHLGGVPGCDGSKSEAEFVTYSLCDAHPNETPVSSPSGDPRVFQRGKFRPYLGSSTTEKIRCHVAVTHFLEGR